MALAWPSPVRNVGPRPLGHLCVLPQDGTTVFRCTSCGWDWRLEPLTRQWFRSLPAVVPRVRPLPAENPDEDDIDYEQD